MIVYAGLLDPAVIERLPVLEHGGRKRTEMDYIREPVCFDIESTNIDEYQQAVMYIWQLQITEDITMIGRSWEEFRQAWQLFNDHLPAGSMIVCYVHNLSYEFQFLKSVIPIDQIFALDDRKVLYFRSGRWEFRCSYLHSNMTLDRFLKAMNVEDQKLTLDYSKRRYPWTQLTQEELLYCIHDVKGLREALLIEMERDHDDLYTIPLTSTGYVRREAKAALAGYQKFIKPWLPDVEVFDMLRAAFRGGNTHANRWNADKIIRASEQYPIYSYDISSSYPSVLLTEKYPARFYPADPKLLPLYLKHGKACLMTVNFYDIRLRNDDWGNPYIPIAKCSGYQDPVLDNGRVLEARELQLTITEVDLDIILEEYVFSEIEVTKLYQATKRQLPKAFRDLLMDMYIQKTALKGSGDDYTYTKVKNKFNSFYGMCVQNPCKPEMIWKDGRIQAAEIHEAEMVANYRRTGWLPYQWGVWCTAYARRKLEDGMQLLDPGSFLYADTDSVKFVGNYDKQFQKLNKAYMRKEYSAQDRNGKIHYIGIYEKENDRSLQAFATMGAKKYAYEDPDGQLHITISGVDKKEGAAEMGSLENFTEGFIFRKAGGTESVYNDDPPMKALKIQNHILPVTSNLYIRNSTYTLSLTYEYKRLLNFLNNVDVKTQVYYDYSGS